jgi:anaerobic dimethyl sulfoxide reductase subunit B (iron-sulfur subunit)
MSKIGLMFDYQYCSGCQSCEIACRNEHGWPLDKWGIKVIELGPLEMEPKKLEWDYIPVPTSYCDLCEDRRAQGGIPTCALHCLSGAIEWGPVEELAKKMDEKGTKVNMFLP